MKAGHRGDDGLTDIMGRRMSKDSPPVEFVGEVDELVAILGIARSLLDKREDLAEVSRKLREIQVKLMKVAGYVALGGGGKVVAPVSQSELEELDAEVQELWRNLVKKFEFTIPSGPIEVTILNYARAVCRRVERRAVKLLKDGILDEVTYRYLNRLSDLLYLYVKHVSKILNFSEEYLE